ncbi:MAG: UDP-N-acetylmuramate dehydrogenase [Bacteroidales bacterium]
MERYFPLQNLNTFGLPVIASYYQKIIDDKQILPLLESQLFYDEKHLFLGGGSNILFLDDFYNGCIVHLQTKGISQISENSKTAIFRVAAGELWNDFVNSMVDSGFGGLENLALIPGTVGAAPLQNIGAYGVELKDIFHRLTAIDLQTKRKVHFSKSECEFGYRSSIFKTALKNRFIITEVDFKLSKKITPNIRYGALSEYLDYQGIANPGIKDIRDAVVAIRRSKLPDPAILGNAGSFFKNPVIHQLLFQDMQKEFPDLTGYPESQDATKISAAWLIEKAQWKGKRIGNAGFHEKQALVLVNHGNSTGRELFNLAMLVKQAVKEKFGIELETEVNII